MEYIYHYTSSEKVIKYILITKKFKFSNIKTTNDPCEWHSNLFSTTDEDRKSLGDKYWEYQKCYGDLLKQNLKVACFTVDNTSYRGYEHPRMWDQYANNHNGVLLRFDKNQFMEEVEKQINNINQGSHSNDEPIGKESVEYIQNFQPNSIFFSKEQLEGADMDCLVKDVLENKNHLFFTKSDDWRDENEFRVLAYSKNDFMIDIDGCLKEITIGFKVTDEDNKSIRILRNKLFVNKPQITRLQYCNGKISIIDDSALYCGDDAYCGSPLI